MEQEKLKQLKNIGELTQKQKAQVSKTLKSILFFDVHSLCMVADQHGIDRNEVFDLYLYMLKQYFDKNDINEIKTSTITTLLEKVVTKLKTGL